ncbi:hypothetical protein D6D02_10353 [Aureobasidium pullulans]|uniref:Uncharacterized protein n=1 Tax=Aureobasidium pullulans TaxID=5580 RepID=A0A4S8YRP3_AURPU|nr:hypothetical protein D6D20_10474 [Aureobasidium pullulans]THX91715.1 hypothetical protein D6D03_10682 [Aureobasidium pullulans]THX93091.1 hypothetical protein D6D02_10353 [Aureobasidium pullulans]
MDFKRQLQRIPVKRKRSPSRPPVLSVEPCRSTFITLLAQPNCYAPVSDLLFGYLDAPEIIALSRVCKALSKLYVNCIPTHWNVDKRLASFVEKPKTLRALLKKLDALIVGSLPLQLFSRLHWKDSSLDILVTCLDEGNSFELNALGDYLRLEGYQKDEKDVCFDDGDYYQTAEVWTHQTGCRKRTVKLLSAANLPLWYCMDSVFFSTMGTCFISGDAAYHLFPKYTFIDGKVQFTDELAYAVEDIISRYCQRGLDFAANAPHDTEEVTCKDVRRDLEGTRRIGDAKTWKISLDCTDEPEHNDNKRSNGRKDTAPYLETCTFRVTVKDKTLDPNLLPAWIPLYSVRTSFSLTCTVFRCCMLQHYYIFDSPDECNTKEKGFVHYLRCQLQKLARPQLKHHLQQGTFVPCEEPYRAGGYNCSESGSQDECETLAQCYAQIFQPPEGWQFADDQVAEIYGDWRRLEKARIDGA